MKERTYIESEDLLVVKTTYDTEPTLEQNKELRAIAPKRRVFNGKELTHVASIPKDHLIALGNMGYDLLSSDPDERRRACVYIQNNEPDWLTVNGKPFATFRPKWR